MESGSAQRLDFFFFFLLYITGMTVDIGVLVFGSYRDFCLG